MLLTPISFWAASAPKKSCKGLNAFYQTLFSINDLNTKRNIYRLVWVTITMTRPNNPQSSHNMSWLDFRFARLLPMWFIKAFTFRLCFTGYRQSVDQSIHTYNTARLWPIHMAFGYIRDRMQPNCQHGPSKCKSEEMQGFQIMAF